MPTTMKLIAKNVLGSDSATVTFGSIPASFDDLYIVLSVRSDRTGNTQEGIKILLNTSTSNFTGKRLFSASPSPGSDDLDTGSSSNRRVGTACAADSTANTFSSTEIYIPNYAGSTNKSLSSASVQETNATTNARIEVISTLWSDTSAINEVGFELLNGNDFVTGSSFYLYGVKHA